MKINHSAQENSTLTANFLRLVSLCGKFRFLFCQYNKWQNILTIFAQIESTKWYKVTDDLDEFFFLLPPSNFLNCVWINGKLHNTIHTIQLHSAHSHSHSLTEIHNWTLIWHDLNSIFISIRVIRFVCSNKECNQKEKLTKITTTTTITATSK